MKKLFLSLFLAAAATGLFAQQITGRVVDKAGNPIEGVSVFYDMTSTYTITDADGRFSLPRNSRINTDIIFIHISYVPQTFSHPYNIPDMVVMEGKIFGIEEVVAVASAEYFTRKEKLAAFRRQFLGTTSAGKSCVIENEDDIQLSYSKKESRLYASSKEPLIIHNRHLGYTIRYFLNDFHAEYALLSLNDADVLRYRIGGQATFHDTNPYSKKVAQRRDEVFRRSYMRFWCDIVNGNVKDSTGTSEFQIFRDPYKRKPLDPEKIFTVTDFEAMKLVEIHPQAMENSPEEMHWYFGAAEEQLLAQINVRYKKYVQSDIGFLHPGFLVDEYGNVSGYSGVLYSGNMADQRVGEMMPRDYVLKEQPADPQTEENPE